MTGVYIITLLKSMQRLFDSNQQLIAKLLFMLILSRFSIPIFHIISFIFYYYNYFLSKLIRIKKRCASK